MKNKSYVLNTALAAIVAVAMIAAILVRTFSPKLISPQLNIPNIALLSLLALLVDHYLGKGSKRCYLCIAAFSVLTFGVLPLAAGFVTGIAALKLALVGGAVFTVLTVLFSSIQERLSSGPAAFAAPLLSAIGLYLAFQVFSGIIL